MMQLLQQQTLQALGDLVLGRIEASLFQEARCVEPGLRQQVPEIGIFRFESGFLEAFGIARHVRPQNSRFRSAG